jgi:hypothetical protein
MQMRHIPPIIIMIISGMIGIRLALSPVAVASITCTDDHPYYLSDCDEPDWTPTPVTVYPTTSEYDLPDTDPPMQIPTRDATQIAELTGTVTRSDQSTQLPQTLPRTTRILSFTMTPTVLQATPTATPMRGSMPTVQDQIIDDNSTSINVECPNQRRLIIKGSTEPYSLLLLTFADRVVGGGMSYASGGYAIPLVVGDEARGIHRIEIRQRNTNKVIKQFNCSVQ